MVQLLWFIILFYVELSTSLPITYCGWSDKNRCSVTNKQICIDRIYCHTPPFNPVCGQPLPPCPTTPQISSDPIAHAFPQAVTTIPPSVPPTVTTTKKPLTGGYDLGPVSFFEPKGGPIENPKLHYPTIINAPVSPIKVNENEPLKLMCSVAEEKSTDVIWVRAKDNKTVAEGKELVIDKIRQKDSGGYYCVARNRENAEALVQTNITVHCPPRIPEGNQYTVLEAKSGDNITLRCDTKCTPEPYYKWYERKKNKDNVLKTCEPLHQGDEAGEMYSYCDLTVAAKANGIWTCVKTNSLGKETQTYEIKPKFIPTKPPPKLTSPPQPSIPPPSTPTQHVAAAKYCEDFEAVGCHTSCATIPYLPKLLFIDTGLTEHYGDTLNQYTKQLVNRCAKEACIGGYAYFGIASYDQCYAGNNEPTTDLQSPGQSQECINGQLKPCSPKDRFCVGQCCSMFVYKIKALKSQDVIGHRKFLIKRRSYVRRNSCSPFKRYLERMILNQNGIKRKHSLV